MTTSNCGKVSECARTWFKQSQANSSDKYSNYLLVESSRSAALKFITP